MSSARLLLLASLVVVAVPTSAAPAPVTEIRYLSGTDKDHTVLWQFTVSGGRRAGEHTTIPVPSNWELQGFGTYNYGQPRTPKSDEVGRYRHEFDVPASWNGRRIQLVFEGAMTDTAVRVNGRAAGPDHQGAQTTAPRAGLTNEEARIVAAVRRGNDAALSLLEEIVNINSGTMNLAGVRRVGDRLGQELASIGFEVRWVDGAPFGRAGHLVAERRGSGRHVLLIGHLDTVFEADSPFQRFERVSATAARGPGIIDMKGGDVIIVAALKALHAAGALEGVPITVVMTGDEEDAGEPLDLARQALREAADRADVAMGFEDGSGDPRRAVIARRGSTSWDLQVTAPAAHSSQIFREDVGAGAIFAAARILQQFEARLSHEPLLTFNPGVIVGGTATTLDPVQSRGTASGKSNVVAADARVIGDLRAVSPEQLAAAKRTMAEIAASAGARATATIAFSDSYPPLAPTDGNRALLAAYDRASRDLGTGPVEATDPRAAGAADVSFAAGRVDAVIDGIGLMGTDDHTARETADLATLPTQTARAAVLIYRLRRP